MEHEGKSNSYMIAISIVASALILSGVIWVASGSIANSVYDLKSTLKNLPSGGGSGTQATPTPSVQQAGSVSIDLAGLSEKGDSNAQITVVEYSDFQCPFCRKFYTEAYTQLVKDYVETGKVKIYYKHFPLSSIHPAAQKSAEASECANDQGKFWEYHNKLFDEQQKLKPDGNTATYAEPELKKWAKEIGLDSQKFNQCLDSGSKASVVQAHFNEGLQPTGIQSSMVEGTPAFMVFKSSRVAGNKVTLQTTANGDVEGRLVGAQPFASFKTAIDSLLAG